MKDSYRFYNKLIRHKIPLRLLLKDERLFTPVPKHWHIIVTDVENSTEAIKDGRHNDVNLAATGSIITVLNTIKSHQNPKEKEPSPLIIPYFFGGDGATFLIPKNLLEEVLMALNNYRIHIKKTLGLTLRVGSKEVNALYNEGYTIKIAKLKLNSDLTVPIVLGLGLKVAEKHIKKEFIDFNSYKKVEKVNLEGMQCRWDMIPPPITDNKIVCLLINCEQEKNQIKIFENIMNCITDSFGPLEERRPISSIRLRLDLTVEKIRKEMYARLGKYNWIYLMKNWFLTSIGGYYFKFFKSGKEYLKSVSQLSDTLMVDGAINTIITGNQDNIDRLIFKLDEMENAGHIKYGIHITYASIMSCFVNDMKKNHIHFVDATEGGYTSAANMYKKKLLLAS